MKNMWKLLLLIIIAVIVGYFIKDTFTMKKELTVYCINSDETQLVTEKRDLKIRDNNDLIKKTIMELKKKPIDNNLKRLIPENVDIERDTLREDTGILELDLSKYYNDLSNIEKMFLNNGVAQTFFQFDFIKGVEYFVDGKEMKKESGEALGVITRKDVVTDPVKQEETKKEEVITLYFVDENGLNFVPTKRKVTFKSGERLEKVVVEELIKGPAENSGLISPIPKGTVLKDIEIKDGICYVDFNRAFIDNAIGGLETSAGELMIYSVVNSLTELKGITKVQFLIDGQKQSVLSGEAEFDNPFERKVEE